MNGKELIIPDFDPCYLALGDTHEERRLRYREFVQRAIPAGKREFIQEAIARGQLTGKSRYIDEVEIIIGRRIEYRRPGRPRATKDENK